MFLRSLMGASLGTRVALRTFLVFALAAALPVALFALVGYTVVKSEFTDSAQTRLDETSKRYGVALNERLIQAEALMIEAARIELEWGAKSEGSALLDRVVISDGAASNEARPGRWVTADEYHLPAGWAARRGLVAHATGGETRIRLHVVVSNGQREVHLIGEPQRATFWDPIVVLPATRICVNGTARTQLHCEAADSLSDEEPVLSAEWALFLKPRYGVDDWLIRVEQSRAVAMSAFSSFNLALPLVALIAIIGATLLSAVHIRRSHRPLALLTAAARRLGRGNYRERVEIISDDEFASVGRAFNGLAARLRRQFGLLAALARIDRQIIEHPTLDPAVAALLPQMHRLVRCDAAALVLESPDGSDRRAFFHRQGTGLQSIAGVSADELRARASDMAAWEQETIAVEGNIRGSLLVGFLAPASMRGSARRVLKGLARRLAVALGNEDRERSLVRLAYFDALTGLPNRALFRERLAQKIVTLGASDSSITVVHIGLDQFRVVNESLGRQAGDELLCGVAQVFQRAARAQDTLARIGGDEFALLLPDMSGAEVNGVVSRVRNLLQAPLRSGEHEIVANACFGIARSESPNADADRLLEGSGAALHRAKLRGRNQIEQFEPSMTSGSLRRLAVEQRLRRALALDRLSVNYQPKLSLLDDRVHSFEALSRWEDDELGSVSPVEFIAVAEDAGLINLLGTSVLRAACTQLRAWRDSGMPVGHVAVNASVHQLRDETFVPLVRATLASHGLKSEDIQIEITESVLANEDSAIITRLRELRSIGVSVAMDDFGTGYSSLASLRDLPIDALKIDRSFVVRSCEVDADRALLSGVVQLAHTLGKSVIAEGVESVEQLELLRELGCDVVQGYLIGRPVTADRIPEFVHSTSIPRFVQERAIRRTHPA